MQHSAHSLFNHVTGFELVHVTEGLPAKTFSLVKDPAAADMHLYPMSLGVAMLARKVADYDRDRLRWELFPEHVTDSLYPLPT
jgi:hypothetical protein